MSGQGCLISPVFSQFAPLIKSTKSAPDPGISSKGISIVIHHTMKLSFVTILAAGTSTFVTAATGNYAFFSDGSDCYQLEDCLATIIEANFEPVAFSDPTGEYSEEEICDMLFEAVGGEQGVKDICGAANVLGRRRKLNKKQVRAATSNYDVRFLKDVVEGAGNKQRGNRDLQTTTCQSAFAPAYPDDSGTGTSYDTWVASIEDLYLLADDNKGSRSDHDAYSALKIAWAAAYVSDGAFGSIPIVGWLTGVAANSLEITIDQCDTHDGLHDSAEIQAAYENSERLLTQTCTISGQLDSVSSTLTTFQSTVSSRFNTVDSSLSSLSTGQTEIKATLATFQSTVNARFNAVDASLLSLGDGQTDIKNQLIALQTSVDTMQAYLEASFATNTKLLNIIRTLLITPDGRRTGYNGKDLICDKDPLATGNCATVPNFP